MRVDDYFREGKESAATSECTFGSLCSRNVDRYILSTVIQNRSYMLSNWDSIMNLNKNIFFVSNHLLSFDSTGNLIKRDLKLDAVFVDKCNSCIGE